MSLKGKRRKLNFAELVGAIIGFMMGFKVPFEESKEYPEKYTYGVKFISLLDGIERTV